MRRFPLGRTLLLGVGVLGISLVWPLFNNFVPIFLSELGLGAAMVGFIMTWDNYINMFVQPLVGERSDLTRTRWGRRKPWIVAGVPLAAAAFVLVPMMPTASGIMLAILATNLAMASFRSPMVALLGDLFPSAQRSTANGVVSLMAGVGAIAAFLGGGLLYRYGRAAPFAFGSLTMLTCVALVIVWVREPAVTPPAGRRPVGSEFLASLRQLFTHPDPSGRMLLLAILLWSLGFNAMETWLSSFGKFALGIDPGRMALLTSGFALLFVISAVPSGLLSNRFGRKRTILVGVASLSGLFVYGLGIHGEGMLLSMLLLAGVAWALVNINALPLLFDVGGPDRIGAFTGIYYFASSLAAIAGPQAVGLLIEASRGDYRVMFLFSAIAMGLAGLCMARVREIAPVAAQAAVD
jgi:MFS family permease